MPQLIWSVKIETVSGQTVFTPDQNGAKPGDPLTAQLGDIVSWRNDTTAAHVIWQTPTNGGAPIDTTTNPGGGSPATFNGLMSNPVAPNNPSSPQYVVAAGTGVSTIYYCCLLHPNEKSSITITTFS